VAEGRSADLVVANNVLAQVPELNDFVTGIELVLAPHGVVTVEVPHVVRLVEGLQFDTIYHEHYSYFSLTTLVALASRHGLELFDVAGRRVGTLVNDTLGAGSHSAAWNAGHLSKGLYFLRVQSSDVQDVKRFLEEAAWVVVHREANGGPAGRPKGVKRV
jgi:hypothetical protein